MPTTTVPCNRPNRRVALLRLGSLMALPATAVHAVSPGTPAVWPNAAPVPGGVVRLSLGAAAVRPVALANNVPVLVLGDEIEWTATPHHAAGYPAADLRVVVPFLGQLRGSPVMRAQLGTDPRATLAELRRQRG